MFTVSIIFLCFISLLALIALAGLICFVGYKIDSAWVMIVVIILVFFFAHFVLGGVFSALKDAYNFSISWH